LTALDGYAGGHRNARWPPALGRKTRCARALGRIAMQPIVMSSSASPTARNKGYAAFADRPPNYVYGL